MDQQSDIELLVNRVREYARQRASDVTRGAETPRLAAVLLQKYGCGVADAVSTIFDNARAADPISQVLDEETAKIDPDWREHNRERWEGRPADIVAGN